jgi:hypothetical protein
VIDPKVNKWMAPLIPLFAANRRAIFFALSDGPVRDQLKALSENTDRDGAGARIVQIDLDFAKLGTMKRGVGFDSMPSRIVDAVEKIGFLLANVRANSGLEAGTLIEAYESEDVDPEEYEGELIRYFARVNSRFEPKHSGRHWLTKGSSQLKLQVDVTATGLEMKGATGRSLYRFVMGQFFATGERLAGN